MAIKRFGLGVLAGILACVVGVPIAQQRRARRIRPVISLLTIVFRLIPGFGTLAMRPANRLLYEFVNRRGVAETVSVMNYGYAPAGATNSLTLPPGKEQERWGYQMYRVVAGAVDLAGKDVLEVGCGRGGGAAFVLTSMAPRSVTGVDFADRAIAHCIANHHDARMRFIQGDAEQLPFPGSSFDAVINIESSHAYPDFDRFLSETHRVLRPSGYLLFADFRKADQLADLYRQLDSAGFIIVDEEQITENVVRSLEDNSRRMQEIVERHSPRLLRGPTREFMALEGTMMNSGFRSGDLAYLRLVLQRAPSPSARQSSGVSSANFG